MSAVLKKEEEVVVAQKEVNVAKELKKLSVDVKLNPKTELVDDKLVVTFDENAYLANAEANGVSELEIKRVQKFHSEFLKNVVKATGEELISGYAKHKSATGFTMDMETTLGKVSLFGDKHTTHSVIYIEPDVTRLAVVDAWLQVQVYFKTTGDRTGKRNLSAGGDSVSLSIETAGITMVGENVIEFAGTLLPNIVNLYAIPDTDYTLPVDGVAADLKA